MLSWWPAAGPHTDWDCVTLLYQLPGNAGLECAGNPRDPQHAAAWLTVDPVAEAPWSVAEWAVAPRFDIPRATVLVLLLG